MTQHIYNTKKEADAALEAMQLPTAEGYKVEAVAFKVTDPDTKQATYHTGAIGMPTIDTVIDTLTDGTDDEKALLMKSVEQGLSGIARNHAVNGRGFALTIADILVANALAGGNRGVALQARRDAIASFVAYLQAENKSTKAVQIGKALLSSIDGIAVASDLHKERMLANLAAFLQTEPNLSEESKAYIAKAAAACQPSDDEADDDF